jgi:hypothetical protein
MQDPDPESGSGVNHPGHISESSETIFGVKYLNSFMPRYATLLIANYPVLAKG